MHRCSTTFPAADSATCLAADLATRGAGRMASTRHARARAPVHRRPAPGRRCQSGTSSQPAGEHTAPTHPPSGHIHTQIHTNTAVRSSPCLPACLCSAAHSTVDLTAQRRAAPRPLSLLTRRNHRAVYVQRQPPYPRTPNNRQRQLLVQPTKPVHPLNVKTR